MLAALLAPLCSAADQALVLTPVTVVSVATGVASPDRAVLVQDGRIRAVMPAAEAGRPANATVISGEGGWLIPGLAEMHAHVPPQRRGEQHLRDFLALMLANGVTTIRGMLGESWHLELRGLLERQEWPGPRLVTSGPSFNGNSVSSPEQAARMAREQAAAGYDFLKLHPGLEPDEFDAIARTAHELGIPFAGHVSFAVGLDAALRAQQATIDHLDGYAQEMLPPGSESSGTPPAWFGLNIAAGMDPGTAPALAAATARAGVWNVPTQSLFETTAGDMPVAELEERRGMEYVSADLLANWRRSLDELRSSAGAAERRNFLQARRRLIRELQAAGAGLLLGSDAPQIMNVPGFSTHQELAYLVGAGLTPLQALQSGTISVARFFGFSDQGEVAAGNVADLLLLGGDPLRDIGNTTRILGVMRAGRWYARAELDEMLEGVKARGF